MHIIAKKIEPQDVCDSTIYNKVMLLLKDTKFCEHLLKDHYRTVNLLVSMVSHKGITHESI